MDIEQLADCSDSLFPSTGEQFLTLQEVLIMKTHNNDNRIESYIAKFDTFHEGTRNTILYKIGRKLRKKFGLEGEALRRYLHFANRILSRPPLDEDEVEKIAASVDKSNTPLGEQIDEDMVETDIFPHSVDECLSLQISFFSSATNTTPIETLTIGEFIEDVKNGKYQELCEAIQAEPDKKRRNELKKRLPCVTPQSVPCKQRNRQHCKSNAIVCIDLDDVGNDLDSARLALAQLPYVFAVCVSASGRGLFVLVALDKPAEDLKPILKKIQQEIPYPIDMACSDISRLRYVSFDPDLIVKDSVIPYNVKQKVTLPKIGIDVLDAFVEQVLKTTFFEPGGGNIKARTYYITSIDHLFRTVKEYGLDIGIKHEAPHVFTGTHWQRIELRTFRQFLQAVGIRQGIPHHVIKNHTFVDQLVKQFTSEARFPGLASANTARINLRNGTLQVTSSGIELKPFDKQDGLTYQLHYDYDISATAPLFQKFLDRVLPDKALQKLFFQYIGYVFLPHMKLGKILFLYGTGANGKSVLLDVIRVLIGLVQCCAYSLEDLTKIQSTCAELGKHLLNICTEISSRMKTNIFKTLASREPLPVNPKYKDPYIMQEYATSIFAMNELPKTIERTDAFFRRFIIIPFDVRIPDEEQDPDLAKKIIDNEMSGVLNYVIEGVKSLLAEGKFDIPQSVKDEVDDFRKEADTVFLFMTTGYQHSDKQSIPLNVMHERYLKSHFDGISIRSFGKRLRDLKYEVKRAGRNNTISVYVTPREINIVDTETNIKLDD